MEICRFSLQISLHNILPIRSYSGPHFPVIGLSTERYGVSLCIQFECRKMRNRISRNTDIFHAVFDVTEQLHKRAINKIWQNILINQNLSCLTLYRKVSLFGVILVRIFRHSDWLRRDPEYTDTFCAVITFKKGFESHQLEHFVHS